MQSNLLIFQNPQALSLKGICGNKGGGDNPVCSSKQPDGVDGNDQSFLSMLAGVTNGIGLSRLATLVGIVDDQGLSGKGEPDQLNAICLGILDNRIPLMTLGNLSEGLESNLRMCGSSEDESMTLTAKDFLLKFGAGVKEADGRTDGLTKDSSEGLKPSNHLGVNENPQSSMKAGEKATALEMDLLSKLGIIQHSSENKMEEDISDSVQKQQSLKEIILRSGDGEPKPGFLPDEVKTDEKGDMGNREIQFKLDLALQEIEKIANTESNKGNSEFSSSHNQLFGRSSENVLSAKETEITPKLFETDVMKQIVEKAVLSLRNGQQAVKISLKPEFLGRLEMKISTVNHQVTVKMLTEAPVVKEIIHNHVHELKAAFQNQGLEIQRFDVSVAYNSDQNGTEYGTPSFFGTEGGRGDDAEEDGELNEQAEDAVHNITEERRGMSRIDFFA
jgi:hypothetical protein